MGHTGPVPPGNATLTGVRIAHNSFTHTAQTTQATKSLTQTAATSWSFDFCDVLLFPQIAFAKVHVRLVDSCLGRVCRPGCVVCGALVLTYVRMFTMVDCDRASGQGVLLTSVCALHLRCGHHRCT